jgi:hypothetical protein
MTDLGQEYRRQAVYCEEMAEKATSPDVKADWLRLAAKWLALIPCRDATPTERFDTVLHSKGTHQKDSKSSH